MSNQLPIPDPKAVIYEDKQLYACLASNPIVRGHVVVVWKAPVADLHLLAMDEYEYLMDHVDEIRTAMLVAMHIKKVYLVYMDEVNQVHWHLVPRYNEKGFDVFSHEPGVLEDYSLATEIRRHLVE